MSVASPVRGTTTACISALLLVALAACATPAPEPAPPSPSVETEPSATSTPSEVVVLGDFGFTYFGDATMDAADVAELEAQLGSPVDVPSECPWYPLVATHGTYAETRAFFDSRDAEAGVQFFYTLELGDDGDMPRTAEGIGVGSTEDEILAAYPDAVIDDDFEDVSLGPMRLILVDDPNSDSRYAFALPEGSDFVNMVQWGPRAGGQWAHLCLPL